MRPTPRSLPLLCLLCVAAGLSACSSLPSFDGLPTVTGEKVLGIVTPYRIDVLQGNVLTKEIVAQIKPGMNRLQVRDILGSPLLTDIFHADRWDYVFTIRRQGAEPQQRRVIAWFDGEKLKKLEQPDELPSEVEFVAAINTFKPRNEVPNLQLSETERKALPRPAPRPTPDAAPETLGPQRSYPPLEPRS